MRVLWRLWASISRDPCVKSPTCRLIYRPDPNHKARYPIKGVGYEPLGRAGVLDPKTETSRPV